MTAPAICGPAWSAAERCVVLLANDVRAEAAFEEIVELILGPTGVPWDWEYPQLGQLML